MRDWLEALVENVKRAALDVRFDADAHLYQSTRSGRAMFGVTGVMREQGFVDTSFHSDAPRQRGTYVHAATVLIDANDLDADAVPVEYAGYCASYINAVTALQPTTLLCEQLVADHALGFAGTLDRFWLLNGDEPTIVDFKAGVPERWHGVQLAGYKRAVTGGVTTPRTIQRKALYLQRDGSRAKLVPYDDRRDEPFFVAAVTCATYKQEFRS